MTIFFDCLVRLPNLKTLEILKVDSQVPISKVFESVDTILPSTRALCITRTCRPFIRNCPNLEDLTFTTGLCTRALGTVRLYGEELKRIAGVYASGLPYLHGELVNKSHSLNNL